MASKDTPEAKSAVASLGLASSVLKSKGKRHVSGKAGANSGPSPGAGLFAALPASAASVASEEDTPVGDTPTPAVEGATSGIPAPPQLDPGVQYLANLFSAQIGDFKKKFISWHSE